MGYPEITASAEGTPSFPKAISDVALARGFGLHEPDTLKGWQQATAAKNSPRGFGLHEPDTLKGWQWPSWAYKNVEVYVGTDGTGRGRWIDGEPLSRVVDIAGRDLFLSVEYLWDG